MGAIANDWLEPLKPEFAKPYYAQLYKKVKEEYTTHQIFPPSDMIFHAFEVTPLEDVKVVILGQDPYHGDGQAHGLCFSVQPQVAIPPSLEIIYKELQDDLGCLLGGKLDGVHNILIPFGVEFRLVRAGGPAAAQWTALTSICRLLVPI